MNKHKQEIMEKFDGFMLGDLMEEDKDTIKAFLSQSLDSYAEEFYREVDMLIVEEMITATSEGQPTSRLTSLADKLNKTTKEKFGIDLTQNK